jgi:hypothetical protein
MKLFFFFSFLLFSCNSTPKIEDQSCVIMTLTSQDKLIIPTLVFWDSSVALQKNEDANFFIVNRKILNVKFFILDRKIISQIADCVYNFSDKSVSNDGLYVVWVVSKNNISAKRFINNKTQLKKFFDSLEGVLQKNNRQHSLLEVQEIRTMQRI